VTKRTIKFISITDAGLAEQVYSLGAAHMHTLDNTITSNPTPVDDDGTPLGPIGERFQAAITSWKTAREALIKALQPANLPKVFGHLDSASSIWTRPRDEYSRRLGFEYIRVNSEFQSLRKTKEVTMDAHITRFKRT
jgi:hypothetical protein